MSYALSVEANQLNFCVRGFELPNMTAMMRQMIRTLTYFEYRISNNAYLYVQQWDARHFLFLENVVYPGLPKYYIQN